MDLIQVILRPYLTEKTFSVRNSHPDREVIAFEVHPKATKHDIKKAFETIYETKVAAVNTSLHKPTLFRTGTKVPGHTKLMKIAYVTLPPGVKLAVTKEEVESAQEEIKKETMVKATTKVEEPKEKVSTAKTKKSSSSSK